MGKQQDHVSVLRSMMQPDNSCQCAECAALSAAIAALTVDEAMASRFMAAFNCEAEGNTDSRIYDTDAGNVLAALQTAIHGESQ